MPSLEVVGGYRERTRSEETHRRTANGIAPLAAKLSRAAAWSPPSASLRHLPARPRYRLQAAGALALGAIVLLAFLLPARTVRIAIDGGVTSVESRASSGEAVIGQAGIQLEPGDRVEETNGALVVDRATEALLNVDGRTLSVRTQAESIEELLLAAGITLGPEDSVLRNGVVVVAPSATIAAAAPGSAIGQPAQLEVRRAVPFSLIENGHELQLRSSSANVATALRDVGVRLGPGDAVQPPLDTELTAGVQVHVDHATPLVVTVPEGKLILYALSDTVGEALAGSAVALPANYRLEPAAGTRIAAGLAVHVVAVSNELVFETERIQSYTVYEPDPTLPPGTQRVVAGQDGVHYRQYEVVYNDDALVSRELAAEWYDPEPADTVVRYSTAPAAAQAVPLVSAAVAADWADLVCSYDWDCSWALAVIACESGGNPNAYNLQGYVGLFQIWEGHGANLRDPATNIAAAYSLYRSGGAGNWPNCP